MVDLTEARLVSVLRSVYGGTLSELNDFEEDARVIIAELSKPARVQEMNHER